MTLTTITNKHKEFHMKGKVHAINCYLFNSNKDPKMLLIKSHFPNIIVFIVLVLFIGVYKCMMVLFCKLRLYQKLEYRISLDININVYIYIYNACV